MVVVNNIFTDTAKIESGNGRGKHGGRQQQQQEIVDETANSIRVVTHTHEVFQEVQEGLYKSRQLCCVDLF